MAIDFIDIFGAQLGFKHPSKDFRSAIDERHQLWQRIDGATGQRRGGGGGGGGAASGGVATKLARRPFKESQMIRLNTF